MPNFGRREISRRMYTEVEEPTGQNIDFSKMKYSSRFQHNPDLYHMFPRRTLAIEDPYDRYKRKVETQVQSP